MKQEQNLTWEDIKEMFAEAARLSKENEKSFKETRKEIKENSKKIKEYCRQNKENLKELKEQVNGYFRDIRESNPDEGVLIFKTVS